MPWARMVELTGLSLAAIQRSTRATGNAASKRNRQESAARVGRQGKDREKPWLSDQMRAAWDTGKFDFHKGRIRSATERETLRLASLRSEVRERRHTAALRRWQRPDERAKLLAYHQREDVRLERSKAQVERMLRNPEKWGRGRGAWVTPLKCTTPRIWTRSSYERIVVSLLDADPDVREYAFEPRVELPTGRWILPDFVVSHHDGSITLIEVKASWVLQQPPEHRHQVRLRVASTYAASMGWDFIIWTEKDFHVDRLATRKSKGGLL